MVRFAQPPTRARAAECGRGTNTSSVLQHCCRRATRVVACFCVPKTRTTTRVAPNPGYEATQAISPPGIRFRRYTALSPKRWTSGVRQLRRPTKRSAHRSSRSAFAESAPKQTLMRFCVGWVEGGENHRQQGGKVLRPELCGRQLLLLQGHAAGLAGVALVNPVVYLNQRLPPKPLRHRGGDLSCRLPRGGMVDFKTGYRLKRGSDASGLVDYRSKSR